MSLTLATMLGINSPILGKGNPLTKPPRLYRKSQIPVIQIDRIVQLAPQEPLIQTSRLLAHNSPDRLHYSNQQSAIGWDNWQPIDRSSNRDDFDYKVDRWRSLSVQESRYDLIDRSSQTDGLENPELDFFTTVITDIDPQLDYLSTDSTEIEIPTPAKIDRSISTAIQPQSPPEIQPKFVILDSELSDTNKIDRLEQPKISVQESQLSANIQPPLTPKASPEIVGVDRIATKSESSLFEPIPGTNIGLFLDSIALNTVDNSHLETPSEPIINLNLDSTQSPDPDLTQISRSVVEEGSVQEHQIAPNLASPPELIPDRLVPNLLPPTTINPAISPQIAPLDSEIKTTIIPESLENITPVTVLKQIATATEIFPIPESSDRLTADRIAPNPLDLSPVVDPQLPEVATTPPPLLAQRSSATENIPSVTPLAIEPVGESSSDTLPVGSDSPIINHPLAPDTAQIDISLDRLAIANLDIPALDLLRKCLSYPLIPIISSIFN